MQVIDLIAFSFVNGKSAVSLCQNKIEASQKAGETA